MSRNIQVGPKPTGGEVFSSLASEAAETAEATRKNIHDYMNRRAVSMMGMTKGPEKLASLRVAGYGFYTCMGHR